LRFTSSANVLEQSADVRKLAKDWHSAFGSAFGKSFDTAHQDWIVRNLSRVSDLISHLADSRSRLMGKLERIAALAGADDR
jgi:hypothetical protein